MVTMATSGANLIGWWLVLSQRPGGERELPKASGLQTTHQTNHTGHSLTRNSLRELQPYNIILAWNLRLLMSHKSLAIIDIEKWLV